MTTIVEDVPSAEERSRRRRVRIVVLVMVLAVAAAAGWLIHHFDRMLRTATRIRAAGGSRCSPA